MKNKLTKIFPLVLGGTLLSGFLGMNLSSQEIATWYTNAIAGATIGSLFAFLYHISISSTIQVKITPIIIIFLGALLGAGLGSLFGISIGAILVKFTKSIVSLVGEITTSIFFGAIVWFLLSAITEIENSKTSLIAKITFSFGLIFGWLGGWIGTVLFNLIGKAENEMVLILVSIGAIIGACSSAVIMSEINKKRISFKTTAG
jgi:hypothetical protein